MFVVNVRGQILSEWRPRLPVEEWLDDIAQSLLHNAVAKRCCRDEAGLGASDVHGEQQRNPTSLNAS